MKMFNSKNYYVGGNSDRVWVKTVSSGTVNTSFCFIRLGSKVVVLRNL